MLLLDKEKRGHSYTSARSPHFSEEKKSKMKAFTKEFVHKILKRLKEKGKLRRSREISGSTGISEPATPHMTGRDAASSASPSVAMNGHDRGDADLMDEMFGVSSEDEDDLEPPALDGQSGTTTSGGVEPSPIIATPSPVSEHAGEGVTMDAVLASTLVNSWKPGAEHVLDSG